MTGGPVSPERYAVAARAAVPPFHVMDLLAAAAARQRDARRPGQPGRGPADDRGAGPGARGGGAPARVGRAARLHGRHRRPRAARRDRRPPRSCPRHRRDARRRRRHDRLLGWLPARLPRGLRRGRPGGDGAAGLPLLPQRAHRARLRGRRDPYRIRRPASSRPSPRSRSSSPAPARSPAWSSPPPPTRPARCCCPTSSPPSPAGARSTACSWSPTRSTTASSTPPSTATRRWRGAPGRPSREAIVFSSFSKYFSMTGWRIGWMLVPERLRRAVDVLTGNFTICPPAIAQRACLAAFDDATYAELDGHVAALRRQPAAAARRPARARDRPAGAGRRRVLRVRRRRPPHRRLDGLVATGRWPPPGWR